MYIITIISTRAHFQPSPEASTICPYFLQHSSSAPSPQTSCHHPSLHVPIIVLVCPFTFFLLLQQQFLLQVPFLQSDNMPCPPQAVHFYVCNYVTLVTIIYFLWLCSPARAMASSFTWFLDHTQRRATFGRNPLDE
jgi:hypothetical protein